MKLPSARRRSTASARRTRSRPTSPWTATTCGSSAPATPPPATPARQAERRRHADHDARQVGRRAEGQGRRADQGQPVLLRRHVRRPDDPPVVEPGVPHRLVRRPGDGAELQRQLHRRDVDADRGRPAGVVHGDAADDGDGQGRERRRHPRGRRPAAGDRPRAVGQRVHAHRRLREADGAGEQARHRPRGVLRRRAADAPRRPRHHDRRRDEDAPTSRSAAQPIPAADKIVAIHETSMPDVHLADQQEQPEPLRRGGLQVPRPAVPRRQRRRRARLLEGRRRGGPRVPEARTTSTTRSSSSPTARA